MTGEELRGKLEQELESLSQNIVKLEAFLDKCYAGQITPKDVFGGYSMFAQLKSQGSVSA